MSSCLPGSITYWVLGIVMVSFAFIGFLLLDQILQNVVQALEGLVPEAPVLSHPLRSLFEARRLQPARPPLGVAALRDEARALQHFQVFGNAGEAQVNRLCQLRDRGLPLGKTSQDRAPGGIGEGAKREARLISCHGASLSSRLTH